MRSFFLGLMAVLCAASFVCAGAVKTVVVDNDGNVMWPQNLNLPSGNLEADSGSFSNLTVNGFAVVATTGGVITVNGLASNQVGSLSGARNVINDPVSGDILGFNGANAHWRSLTNTDDNINSLTTIYLTARSGIITTATVTRLIIGGTGITNFNEIAALEDQWAKYPALTNVNVGGFSMTNISSIRLGAETISSWGDITNTSSSASNWAAFKASRNIDAGGKFLTNAMGIELNSESIYEWQDLTNFYTPPNPTTWAYYPALVPINGGGQYITNITAIMLDDDFVFSWGQITNMVKLQASNWANYAASANVDMGGRSITNLASLTIGSTAITNFSDTTNVANWSAFTALHAVDLSSNVLTNASSINFKNGGYFQSDNSTLYFAFPGGGRMSGKSGILTFED
jgi:hypothetical protein